MTELDLAFSPCPNDTFIFHALLHGLIDTGAVRYTAHLHDVEALNQKAFEQTFHVTKLSFYAYLKLKKYYTILDSGAALGHGCGPLLVARAETPILPQTRVAIPGELTTAYLLLRLWRPELRNIVVTRFDNILAGVQAGQYEAGLIIHEGRFIYHRYDCVQIVDLGAWWEKQTGLPIPLGCIAMCNQVPNAVHPDDVASDIRRSVEYAFANRAVSRAYIKTHAQEMDASVIDGHIDLYVNAFTLSLGPIGRKAVAVLEEMAQRKKIL